MKIAIVYDPVYPWSKGGGEKALWELSAELVRSGHEIHYFGMRHWGKPATIRRAGVHIHGVCPDVPLYAKSGRRSMAEPLLFAAGLLRAFWRMRRERFDVVNCISFPYASVLVVALLRALGIIRAKFAVTWLEVWGREYWRDYLKSPLLAHAASALERACAALGDSHICISELTRSRLGKLLGVPAARSATIPFGIHGDEGPASPATKSRGACVTAARLVEHKNVTVFVDAWPEVLRQCPGATAVIIGEGPLSEELRSLIARRRLGDSIVLAGWLDREMLIREIARAEVLVHPSTREGQGLVALEAMALGTAVVAARHPENAITDFLRDGENGLLINEYADPKFWAAAIVGLLRDHARRELIAANATRTALGFDWQSGIVARYIGHLETLRAQNRPPPPQEGPAGQSPTRC